MNFPDTTKQHASTVEAQKRAAARREQRAAALKAAMNRHPSNSGRPTNKWVK